jgi:hypothetical protein
VIARALARRPDDRFATAAAMREALREAALQAAEAPLVTVVATLVQDAARPWADDGQGTRRPDGAPAARVVVSESATQPRLVDAIALYSSGTGPHGAAADPADADADADRTLAARKPQ